jgi:hypothetical protein
MTMPYTEKELRAADLLALILIVFGLVAGAVGCLRGPDRWVVCGIVLVCLGASLEVKVRRIMRNRRYEDKPLDD